ncbi:TetR/AcrR family transcriptional regulator [Actinomadura viridis]|uniref:AcrR family transcriptional regulator n=1 Tax=Actinomadura viridis TaxID=58110 RepID=A0A931DL88_9ACTN|nr:TetR/AcrR family transcriptional regulator [Actinomadura viridis]MBG6091552.1 AcrR family transcriptional regulator [Actinomadura viridis]
MSPDPARRSERSRQAILTATRELLFEVGYPKLTIEAIAARAGVGKQTIYRWWPSKGAVMFDSLLPAPAGAPELALPDTGDVEADLKTVLRAIAEEFETPYLDQMTRALATEVHNDPTLGEEMVKRLLMPHLEATKERLRSAQAAGQLAAGLDLQAAVEMLFAPLFYRWMLRIGPLTPEYADTVATMAVAAMRPH